TTAWSALSTKTSPTPTRNATSTRSQIDATPAITVPARAAMTRKRANCPVAMSLRRSTRSTTAPPISPKTSHGSHTAADTAATGRGREVIAAASSGSAVTRIPSPSCDTADAVQKRRNLGPSEGALNDPARQRRSGERGHGVLWDAVDVGHRVGDQRRHTRSGEHDPNQVQGIGGGD